MTEVASVRRSELIRLSGVLGDEGFRVFFPLAALQLAFWPALWALVHGFDLPLARTTPPVLWHSHEMIVGGFGAALLGFATTAFPEWTGAPRPQGRSLFALAALWAIGRAIGLLGWDALGPIAAVADLAWMIAMFVWALAVSARFKTTRLLAFAGWILMLALCEAVIRFSLLHGEVGLAQAALQLTGFAFLGLVGLALARITTPVTNLVLDPSEQTSPFRPHPGRLYLAPGLVMVVVLGELAGLSPIATGFLVIAAGAAFLDRVAEAFIGRAILRAEILALAGASLLAGIGLLLVGAARLGAPIPETAGLHVALMGGVGLGVLAVFSTAGLLHSGYKLGLARLTRVALTLIVVGTALRVAPELDLDVLPGPPHGLASLVWASAFMIWLRVYWPIISDSRTLAEKGC
jgi:uncharacterized protein involved in response to NO